VIPGQPAFSNLKFDTLENKRVRILFSIGTVQ
jgi:hypothetical protein